MSKLYHFYFHSLNLQNMTSSVNDRPSYHMIIDRACHILQIRRVKTKAWDSLLNFSKNNCFPTYFSFKMPIGFICQTIGSFYCSIFLENLILNLYSETHEFAAHTVKWLYDAQFHWSMYGTKKSPIQVSFSLPDYQGPVLLKSFEIFFKEVIFNIFFQSWRVQYLKLSQFPKTTIIILKNGYKYQ